ncbi:hypothetical protein CDAR_546171 [Caerostris darwini]|uniref:Uncharacterized protein n=1 Tax=Caerostris darwini TaxID=1538125 RepID=A0AAV4VEY3_9ARAC|nr:hypothetical protein CDAR_546171 [Caerostris darwini]
MKPPFGFTQENEESKLIGQTQVTMIIKPHIGYEMHQFLCRRAQKRSEECNWKNAGGRTQEGKTDGVVLG